MFLFHCLEVVVDRLIRSLTFFFCFLCVVWVIFFTVSVCCYDLRVLPFGGVIVVCSHPRVYLILELALIFFARRLRFGSTVGLALESSLGLDFHLCSVGSSVSSLGWSMSFSLCYMLYVCVDVLLRTDIADSLFYYVCFVLIPAPRG